MTTNADLVRAVSDALSTYLPGQQLERDAIAAIAVDAVERERAQPTSLREQVARAWCSEYYGAGSGSAKDPAADQLDAADAVLTVVADWLAAQPRTQLSAIDLRHAERNQRNHDVRLLRGES